MVDIHGSGAPDSDAFTASARLREFTPIRLELFIPFVPIYNASGVVQIAPTRISLWRAPRA